MRMALRYMLGSILLLFAGSVSCLGESAGLSVTATILSKNQCKFTPPDNRTLAFGDLNPLAPADVMRQITLTFDCNGSEASATYFIGDDDGQHESGPDAHRMAHLSMSGIYLPYTFTFSPVTGSTPKGADQTLTITGTLFGDDYRTAYAGNYSDRVTLSINP